ncbi:MAG: zinc ribbon domain-containing protein [Clostridia bacterium]|nr:zinc ribbon domain-containing protein [Clostridia bacterium]MBR0026108.1 zinc ribbon domain-containing protein [Clostridia bacterium]
MFRGRYGIDPLNRTLLIVALVFSIASTLTRSVQILSAILSGFSLALLAILILRMFSRNFEKRQQELQKYFSITDRIRSCPQRMRDRRNYKYLSCPQCMQKLRVPRGKGRLRVTCTRCGNRFETKS